MSTALLGARLFDGERFLDDHAVLVDGNTIANVVPKHQVPDDMARQVLNGGLLAPGFIDLQVNGGGGVLFNNDPSVDALKRITAGHRKVGTTRLLPTTISDTPERLQACMAAVKDARVDNPGILGMHIEGPFFNVEQRGVHHSDYLRAMNPSDLERISALAQDMPVLLTLAPEMMQPGQIAQLVRAGVEVSAGHTHARYEEVERAIQEGLNGVTHLYNAMRPLQGREPGVVGAALTHHEMHAGIIVDNFHVHPASVLLAYRAKPLGKLYLVSDSMATVGSTSTSFTLYDETLTAVDGRLVTAEGRLAGSAIGLIDAVRCCVRDVGIPLEHALAMASRFPAEYLHLDEQLGWLKPGHQADLVHLDDDLNVLETWVAGIAERTENSAGDNAA